MMKKQICSLCGKALSVFDDIFRLNEEIVYWEEWSKPKIILKIGDALCGECVRDIICLQERFIDTEPEIIY